MGTQEPEKSEAGQLTEEPEKKEAGQTQEPEKSDAGQLTEKPEVNDEAKQKAKEMSKAYSDDLQTTTLPGSDGTVSGTAVTDWVDDEDKGKIETSAEEGKVEYRKSEEFRKIQES
jgi:hypothetical protein